MSSGRTRRACALALLVCASVLSACDGGGAPGAADGRVERIMLVSVDTLRADRVGCYGAQGAETPALDALAAEGVRFATAISPAPITLPSHATLLTGLDPPHETICWIVAIAYDNAKEWDYARKYLIDMKLIEQLGGVLETDANSPNQGNMTIKVRWPFTDKHGVPARSILQVKSSVNEKTLQGEQVKTCIMSEAAEHDRRIYEKYLRTRCKRIIFPTTPKRKALWLYEHFQRGKEDPSLSIEHFQFDRFCNPLYDHAGYERAKQISNLTYGSFHRRSRVYGAVRRHVDLRGRKGAPVDRRQLADFDDAGGCADRVALVQGEAAGADDQGGERCG